MLKLKKVFLLGLLAVAVSLFTMSCTESSDDPTDFRLTVVDAQAYFVDGGVATTQITSSTVIYEGDTIQIQTPRLHGTDITDEVFDGWTGLPSSVISGNAGAFVVRFVMPARNLTVRATYIADAFVRFSWDRTYESNLLAIAADSADVADWYETVWYDNDCDLAGNYDNGVCEGITITAEPDFGGNPAFVGSVYSSTLHNSTGSPYRNVFLPAPATAYTAIASLQDNAGYMDIVANYSISGHSSSSTATRWFEVVFLLEEVLNGEIDDVWERWSSSTPMVDPEFLRKAGGSPKKGLIATKTSKVVSNGATMDITYYLLRR